MYVGTPLIVFVCVCFSESEFQVPRSTCHTTHSLFATLTTMRAPRCLEDTTLLLEEPLASSFAGQDDVTKTALLTLFQKTAKKVQAAPGGVRAFPPFKNCPLCNMDCILMALMFVYLV
jgi:hypothetical protein